MRALNHFDAPADQLIVRPAVVSSIMCGRFPQSKEIDKYNKRMGYRIHVADAEAIAPTYNLAPSRLSWTIRAHEDELEAVPLKWGFGNAAGAPPPINARVETAATKFTFRDAWQHRRLLVPGDGWYEWKMDAGSKQPYYFVHRDGEPVFFAGLWTGETFCMFTTAADGELTAVHHRKPLVLTPDQGIAWIKSGMTTEALIEAAEKAETFTLYPVSKSVSNWRNDGASLIERADLPSKRIELVPKQEELF